MQGNTVVAKRDECGFYHAGCNHKKDARPFTPDDEENPADPELIRHACKKCGRWILDGWRWDAYMACMARRQNPLTPD